MERTYEYARFLRESDLIAYTSLGRNRALNLGKDAGARVRYGRRIMYDREKIDAYLDRLAEETTKSDKSA